MLLALALACLPVAAGLLGRQGSLPTPSRLELKLPPSAVDERLSGVDRLVLYDGVCRFCNTWVNLALRVDTREKLRYAALQSEAGATLLESAGRPGDISSIVYMRTGGEMFLKSAAVTEIARDLDLGFVVLASNLLPLKLKDALYDFIAGNRYSIMGTLDECRLSDPNFDHLFLKTT